MCTENQRRNRQVEAYDRSHNTRIIQVWRRGGGGGGERGAVPRKETHCPSNSRDGGWGLWSGSGRVVGVCWGGGRLHRGPCRASYLATMFLQRPSSFLMSATSMRRAAFSFSRKLARIAIWFSFSRRASRDRFAATLFFLRRAQYRSSWRERKRRADGSATEPITKSCSDQSIKNIFCFLSFSLTVN